MRSTTYLAILHIIIMSFFLYQWVVNISDLFRGLYNFTEFTDTPNGNSLDCENDGEINFTPSTKTASIVQNTIKWKIMREALEAALCIS